MNKVLSGDSQLNGQPPIRIFARDSAPEDKRSRDRTYRSRMRVRSLRTSSQLQSHNIDPLCCMTNKGNIVIMRPAGFLAAGVRCVMVFALAASLAPPALCSSTSGATRGLGISGGEGSGGSGVGCSGKRLGAITGDEFLPEPLPHPCEMAPHLYPQRRYEHGTMPGMRDSEEESEYLHEKAANGGTEPDTCPGWAKHLRMKLRIAQVFACATPQLCPRRCNGFMNGLPIASLTCTNDEWKTQKGHLGAIAPSPLDAAGLGRADPSGAQHERQIWDRVAGKMIDLMDVGCGHNSPSVDTSRAQMYKMMASKAPETRAQRGSKREAVFGFGVWGLGFGVIWDLG